MLMMMKSNNNAHQPQFVGSVADASTSTAAHGEEDIPPPVNPNEVDELLSKELEQLSFKARSTIMEEIHGVACLAPEETPELLLTSLYQMNYHLFQIHSKPSFDLAQKLPKTYVNDDDFRLKFLRAELFETKKYAFFFLKNSLQIL